MQLTDLWERHWRGYFLGQPNYCLPLSFSHLKEGFGLVHVNGSEGRGYKLTGGKGRSRNVTFSGIRGNNCHASFPVGWRGGAQPQASPRLTPPVLTGRGEDTEAGQAAGGHVCAILGGVRPLVTVTARQNANWRNLWSCFCSVSRFQISGVLIRQASFQLCQLLGGCWHALNPVFIGCYSLLWQHTRVHKHVYSQHACRPITTQMQVSWPVAGADGQIWNPAPWRKTQIGPFQWE